MSAERQTTANYDFGARARRVDGDRHARRAARSRPPHTATISAVQL